jgi:ABC-2 type transport system permease protein
MMIARIARKEMTEMFRDGRFRLASAIVTVLLLASLGAGWKHYSDVRAQHSDAQAAERQNWLQQEKRNPHSAAHYGVYAFKPKSQLAMIDTGVDPYVGVSVWLEAHKQNEFKFRPAQDGTSLQRFGELTAAVVLQILIPLLIVLLTFSSFAGEREQGTLRQLLSMGVHRRDLTLGKALGIAGAMSLVLGPAVIVGVLALMTTSTTGLLAGDFSRTVLMMLAYAIYFSIFLGVSLAVSAIARTSRLALVGLMSFWLLNGLIATRAFSDIAGYLHPTPSAVEFSTNMERDIADRKETDAKLDEIRSRLMNQYGVSKVEDLPVNFTAISLQEGENHGDLVFDKHYNALFDQFQRQNGIYELGSLVAPLIAIRSISMGLAGTDFLQHRHFTVAAEEYRRLIQRTMNDDILKHPVKSGQSYLAGKELWEKVPGFSYEAPDASWVLNNYRMSITFLLLWVVVSAAVALAAARRAAC